MNSKIVAIHQPNFFPWLGYFNKIHCSDCFIIMDNVQFPETGRGSWINRVKLLVQGIPKWNTMPVMRTYHGYRIIAEMQIDDSSPWRSKFLKTIRANYAKAAYFNSVLEIIEPLVMFPSSSVADFNINAITTLCEIVGIDTAKMIRGTSLDVSGNATELLIAMTNAADGTSYVCGGGSDGYQEDDLFAQNNIQLVYQNFKHPEYPQCGSSEFIPGQSIIDVLMNCGVSNTKELITA